MAGLLEADGYEPPPTTDSADVIVINTCSVRERAEEKLYTRLGEIREDAPERGTSPLVAVTGCVAQQEGDQAPAAGPSIDVIVGTQSLKELPRLARARRPIGGRRGSTSTRTTTSRFRWASRDHPIPCAPGSRSSKAATSSAASASCRTRAATSGCGRSRDILAEVTRAAETGRVEVQLLGQIVNHYQAPDDRGVRLRRAARTRQRRPGHSSRPVRQPASASRHAAPDRRHARPAARSASTSTCRCSRARTASSRPCAGATRARRISSCVDTLRADDPGRRAVDGHDRRLPGRDRRGLRPDAGPGPARPATTRCTRSSTRRGRTPWPSSACRTTCPRRRRRGGSSRSRQLQGEMQGAWFTRRGRDASSRCWSTGAHDAGPGS